MSGDERDFDQALIREAFVQAAIEGWDRVSVAQAAQAAGLDLGRARARFPFRGAILMRLGLIADQAALEALVPGAAPRDAVFDMLMRRLDVLQAHRDGVLALLRALPRRPMASVLLGMATERSLGWLLAAAGVPVDGLRGRLRRKGMVAVWLYTLRAWTQDDSADLSRTMAALDRALDRAMQAERMAGGGGDGPATPPPFPDLPPEPPEPSPMPPPGPLSPAPLSPVPPEPPLSPDLASPGPVPSPDLPAMPPA